MCKTGRLTAWLSQLNHAGRLPAHQGAEPVNRGSTMRIVGLEDLHADGGWRTTWFLKLTTD